MLLAGVMLHDIAKTAELSFETGFGYTDEGQLLGHIVLVSGWIREAARELGDVDPETVLQLEHLVISHHGKLEFGSPKKPMTAEAIAFHFIDNLDAKLAGFWQAYRESNPAPGDARWGDTNFMLEVRPYFPRRLDGLSEELLPPHLEQAAPPSPPPRRAGNGAPEPKRQKSGDLPF
jgi:3'-5' exoribonuclease